jgi:hypothetical protein
MTFLFPTFAYYINAPAFATVARFTPGGTYSAGNIVTQVSPVYGSELCFVCTIGGVAGAEPAWTNPGSAVHATFTTGACTFIECTGHPGANGDSVNCYTWSEATNNTPTTIRGGVIIQRNSGASFWIASANGTTGGSEPSWASNNAGQPQTDGTVTWYCIGSPSTIPINQAPIGSINAFFSTSSLANWFDGTQGQIVFIADNHSENFGSGFGGFQGQIITSQGLAGAVVSYDHTITANPPGWQNLKPGATLTTGPGFFVNNAWLLGNTYCYGLTMYCSFGSPPGDVNGNDIRLLGVAGHSTVFEACTFKMGGLGYAVQERVVTGDSNTSTDLTFINCQVWGATPSPASPNTPGGKNFFIAPAGGIFRWINTPGGFIAQGSSLPSTFVFDFQDYANSTTTLLLLEGIDFTAIKFWPVFGLKFFNTNVVGVYQNVVIKDCALPAGFGVNLPGDWATRYSFINSDIAPSQTNSLNTRYMQQGIETTELNITRVGGATDPQGRGQARKIATGFFINTIFPFQLEQWSIYNTKIGKPLIISLHGTWFATRVPFNDELWFEIVYPGYANTTLGAMISTGKPNFLAPGIQYATKDSSVWNGGGSGSAWTPFVYSIKLDGVVLPFAQFKGNIWVRPRCASINHTFYLDPKIVLS